MVVWTGGAVSSGLTCMWVGGCPCEVNARIFLNTIIIDLIPIGLRVKDIIVVHQIVISTLAVVDVCLRAARAVSSLSRTYANAMLVLRIQE